MTDFTQTVSNSLFVGGAAPEVWGTMVWGTDPWGALNERLEVAVDKLIDNSQTIAVVYAFDVLHLITETIASSEDLSAEALFSGDYNYVFVSETTAAEDRASTTYAEASGNTPTYASSSAGSADWTET